MSERRKYGEATTILFPLVDAGAQDFEATPVTFAAGDTQVMQDEAAFANTSNNPAHEGNGIYSLALTATEMQAARIVVTVIDQTATKEWKDQAIVIETEGDASAQHPGVLADIVEGTTTVQESLALQNAAAAGKLSGAATTSVAIRNLADTLDRIAATVDADGNRSATTLIFTDL